MSVKNLVQCPLITPVSSTATELLLGAVSAPYSLPPLDGGILVISDSPSKPSFVEFIQYTHRIDNVLYGVSRGQEETEARAWSGVTYVYQALTADQYTSELASKEPVIPSGTTAQYWRGDKSFQDLATAIRAANLTGFSTATNSPVVSTDTLLAALGKLQAQVSARLLSTANAVSATKLQTARTISVAGDATGSLTFDGTANVSMDVTLQPSGVTAGTYTKLTVDSTGRVTGGTILLVSDVPTLNQNTTGNAGTATKLQTSRTINGVPFDGTANITVADSTKEPAFAAGTTAQYRRGDKTWQDFATAVRASVMTGLSTVTATAVSATDTLLAAIGKLQAQITGLDTSKLDATANAVSASKLATARSIALAGDVTGSTSFDGSANVSITATVANDSHTHDTRYPVLSAERVLTGVAAGSWVTIAQVPSQGGRAYGEFIVYDTDSGKHNVVKIIASHSYGQSVVACVGGNRYGSRTIAHVRVLHGTVDRLNDGAKLQVYIESTCALRVRALMINQISGWSAWSEMTPVVEGTPAGWVEDATTRYDDITNTATGFSGSFSGNGALLTGLNAANLASGTIPDARLSGTYTGVNITGNAATATKLATARTIALAGDVSGSVAFDGSGNVSITTVVADDSHNHTVGNVDGLQAALDGKLGSTATAAAATKLATARSINGVSFDGTANITVTAAANGGTSAACSGNAATATALQTARTINGVSFNGTANITVADATKLPIAGGSMTGNLTMNDNVQVRLGSSADCVMYHSGTHTYIDQNVTGDLYLRNQRTGGSIFLQADSTGGVLQNVLQAGVGADNACVLMANGSTRLTTTAAGVSVTGTFIASGDITAYSDIRLKKDIEVIPDALNKVVQLRGVTYERRDSGDRQVGVIAQEVQKVLPEAVIQGEEYLSVAYGNMVGLLIESIKELNGKVESLQEEVTELRRAA